MADVAIKLENVSKRYKLGQMGYRSLREDIVNIFRRRNSDSQYFWALSDVSFEVKRGEAVGIIGHNGAGKSTILKLLAGVTTPCSGTVMSKGKIGALIELTAGFHTELTGRENIYLYGSIIGMKKYQINERFDDIVAFSGLEKFIDTPIKRYSSGMLARLGFSVSSHLDPDILLVDEVLSVGDYIFQDKCIKRMKEYRARNKTIVFVSHNLDAVRKLCERAVFINKGRLCYDGDVENAIRMYYESMAENLEEDGPSHSVKLTDTVLTNGAGQKVQTFEAGEKAVFTFKAMFNDHVHHAIFSMFIRHPNGLVIYDVSSDLLTGGFFVPEAHKTVTVRFEFDVNLLRGVYNLGYNIMGSSNGDQMKYLQYSNNAFTFTVKEMVSQQGIADLKANCEIEIGSPVKV